jgi:heptosyltransferase III
MSSVLECLPDGARVAVVRLRSMGDCILTTPAISILKQSRPDLSLSIVVEERFVPLFEGNPDVTETFLPDPSRLRKWRPHLCLNLHGGGRSAALTAFSGARFRAGFAHFQYSPIYNVKIPRAQQVLGVERKVHTAEHLASAMFYLGAGRVEIPRAKLFAANGIQARTPLAQCVIHPCASTPEKTWPAERFIEAASYVEKSLELEPVFISGPGEDLSRFRRWRTLSAAPLAEIKSLISSASLFIGNDSGPAHMAAAFGIPSVVIFGASDPVAWAPWRTQAEVLTGRDGTTSIGVHEAIEAFDRLRVRA